MTLDRFDPTSPSDERSKETSHDKSAAELFATSALYELHQSAVGLAQTVGLQDRLPQMEQPKEDESWGCRQLQMLGRGFGSFIPSAGAALVSRYGVGKVIEHLPAAQVADNVLLKRSVIGLSATESVATGALTGALFKPTDAGKVDDWKSFLTDRTESALSSGIAFGVTSIGTFGWSKFAASAPLSEMRLSGFLKSAPVTGAVSGIFGGIANAESSSLVTDGKLTFDGKVISQSIYEMSVTGGLFGVASGVFGRSARDARATPSAEHAPMPPKYGALPFPDVPTLDHYSMKPIPSAKIGALDGMEQMEAFNKSLSDRPGLADTITDKLLNGTTWSENLFQNMADFVNEDPGKRIPVLSSLAEADLSHFKAGDLLAAQQIHGVFEHDQSTFKRIIERSEPVQTLSELADFIGKDVESRAPLVAKVSTNGKDFRRLQVGRLEDLNVAQKLYGLNSKTFDQLIEFDKPSALVNLAVTRPESVETALQTLHDLGVKNLDISYYNVDTFVAFADKVAHDRSLFDRLKAQSISADDLTYLANFFGQSGTALDKFKTLSDLGVKSPDFYQLNRLTSMLEVFGDEPELMTGALNLQETQRINLANLHALLEVKSLGQMLALRNALRQAISFTGASGEPSFHEMFDSYVPPKYFEKDMPLSTAISNASRDWRDADAVFALAKFVEDDPGRRAAFAAHLVNSLGEEVKVTPEYLRGSEKLFHSFAGGDGIFSRLARSFAPQLGSISDFIDKDPVANRQLVLDELESTVIRGKTLSAPRLEALVELNKTYGADSDQVRALRMLETSGVSLASVNKFVQDAPENKAFLTKLLDMHARPLNYLVNNLDRLLQLSEALGQDSVAFGRIVTGGAHSLLDETLAFLKGDYEVDPSAKTDQLGTRAALLAQVASDFEYPFQLSGRRLQGLFEMQRKLGDAPQALAHILANEIHAPNLLPELHLLSKSEFGTAFIRHAFQNPKAFYDLQAISDLTELAQVLKPGPELAKRFVNFVESEFRTRDLTYYLRSDPARVPSVQKMIADGASARELSGNRLLAVDNLRRQLSNEPDVLTHLVNLERSGGMDLSDVVQFLHPKWEAHIEMLKDLQAENAPASDYSFTYLMQRVWAKENFSDRPDILQKLLARRSEGVSLGPLTDFSNSVGQHVAKPYLENLIEENAPASRFQFKDMVARSQFARSFGLESPLMPRLMELSEQGLDVAKFSNSLAFRTDLIPAVQAMVERGAGREELEKPNRLLNIASLYKSVGLDTALMDRIDELRKQGLDATEVGYFVSLKPDLAEQFREYVQNGFSARELSVANLTDLDLLRYVSTWLDPSLDAVKYLQNLQRNGLQGAQLVEYVRERPEERPSIVENLIREKADLSVFKDLMRLTAFPDDIAHTLVTKSRSGGMPVTEIVRNLSSWEYGAAFERLVRARALERKPLDAEQLRALVEQAKSNPDIRGEDKYPWKRDLYRNATAGVSDLAQTLKHTADRIDSLIPQDKPIVLLGRDTWPLVPILRERGHDTQYFLWSRNNSTDEATYKQWMKEVKPGSVVIDSGFNGSVINWIKERDKTASGLLMSSNNDSPYDQILTLQDHSIRVGRLEELVKLINRSKSYTENGGALVTKGETKDGTVAGKYRQFVGVNRWRAQSEIRDLLRASGVPEWYVWRYGNYVGMRPEDRIGLDSRSEVEEHYKQVEAARKRASELAVEAK